MILAHAPSSSVYPLLPNSRFSMYRSFSLTPVTKNFRFNPRTNVFRFFTLMANANLTTSDASLEHVAGNWYSVPELRLRDHYFTVPLDYSLDRCSSPKISVFAREVVAVGKEDQPLPYLLYLQGGPGFECSRPTESSGWIQKACDEFRVVLMDQRGTGLSTALTVSSMSQLESPEELANYLKHFRADNIVNDAEFIRVRLVPDAGAWSVLGQSYGGFCAVTYLSFAPHGLKQVFLTGGIPPIGSGCTADSVYRACYEQVVKQNKKYYNRFPQDVKIVQEVVEYLAEQEGGGVLLPSGSLLTAKGLQTLGFSSLGSRAGFERLHYLFERVWDPIIVPGGSKRISYHFLTTFDRWLAHDTNPLYFIMHESIYCQGAPSRWSAQRIREEVEWNLDAIKVVKEGRPVFFTGEMIFPWMFDEVHSLRPLKDAAHILAKEENWPPLYNIDALRNNKVPVAAAIYYEDVYVSFKLSMETASEIAGIRLWVTNEYMHSGLRDGGGQFVEKAKNCVTGMVANVEKPKADIKDVDFKRLSAESVEYLAVVGVENPYSHDIPICQISYTLKSANRVIASGTVPDPGSIKGKETTSLDVQVKVAHSTLVSLAKDVGADWDIDYELELGLTVDLPIIGDFTIPLSKKGEMKLPSMSDIF